MFGSLISSVTVGAGGASSITFSSIPQTYTDLVLVCNTRHTSTNNDFAILQINGTTTNYSYRYLIGNGASASSNTSAGIGITNSIWIGYVGGTANSSLAFNSIQVTLPNYTGSTNKTISVDGVNEDNTGTAYQIINAGLWSNTAAITSLTLKTYNDWTFAQYSTAYLYGTLKGSGGATVA